MKKQLFASIAVASTIGFFTPLTSYAFGLGEIKVMSALNEPFKASIDINALPAEEKESFEIRIASNEEFEKAGLDRSYILTQLKFDVVEQQGKSRVLISSQQAIKEPFLDFLLTASAGGGRLIREYTVLLDPPEVLMTSSTAKTRSAPSVSSSVSIEPESSQSNTLWSSGQKYGPVAKADTLWNIALTTRPDASVSVQQMMMALVEANPEAFVDNNINGLKAGYTLTIPDQAAILSKSQAEAYRLFKNQNAQWRQRDKTVVKSTPAVVQQPQTASTETDAVQTDAENSTTENTQASSTTESNADEEAHLKLVAPEQSKTTQEDASPNLAGNEKINALTEQLTLAQETIEAQAQENIDFKARMDAMEEQLETMRRLISLKDADLARLQDLLEEKDQANTSAEAMDDVSDTESTPETEADASSVDESDSSSLEAEVSAPAEIEETVVEELPPADDFVPDNLVDTIKAFLAEYKLQLGGALLVVLLLLLLLARRKNNEDTSYTEVADFEALSPTEDDKQYSPEMHVDKVPENHDEDEHVDDEPVSEQQDPQKSVMELVEQADMFVGYADYAQAKVALEQAKAREPDNTLVAYKLLFVLYKQKQVDDFVALAEATNFDEDSIEWDEIKQWGAQLAPDHALFAADESVETDIATDDHEESIPVIDDEADDKELDFSAQDETDNVPVSIDLSEDNHDAPLEFDTVDISSPTDDEENVIHTDISSEEILSEKNDTTEDNHIDDDLLSFDTGTTFGTVEEDKEDESEIEHDSLLPFEPGASSSLDPKRVDIAPFDMDADDEPDIEFDIGDIDEIDEAETKLDLASAYIEMDDTEGARSILNEVLAEGNEEQKARAQTILDSLSE
ncbi:FimV/HubP family polar landmark protein [Methylophaga sulfidovorans]|nr:FimV/HubP family polar landmark protein [Methylophaga sulfidovorans]